MEETGHPRKVPRRAALALLLLAVGCSEYQPFDSVSYLRQQYEQRVGNEASRSIEVPFELTPEIEAALDEKLSPAGSEEHRVERILDLIFNDLGLRYSLMPTRDAVGTYRAREGNCLSFVNLFVGIARRYHLDPMYVEVNDLQRWNQRNGMTISQGHIVAGLYVNGKLRTYDFLPYKAKSYKDFTPIDDVKAAAHFYNNLGAEALLAGDLESARRRLEIATRIAPSFTKAVNNLGVLDLREGETQKALELFRGGLEEDPKNVALLTNLARTYQQLGRPKDAAATLAKIEDVNTTNPFYFVYRGEVALEQGHPRLALQYMVKAFRQDTEVPEVHLGFVKVYLALGELDKARHHLQRALTLDATNQEARRYATILEGRRGSQ